MDEVENHTEDQMHFNEDVQALGIEDRREFQA